jgi:hypothetical protein
MDLETGSLQSLFDSTFLNKIQCTACPKQFKPGDTDETTPIDWFESLLDEIKLRNRFSSAITDQTRPTLSEPEDRILTYGYHKKYEYDPSKPVGIEWFFSTFDDPPITHDASTTCDDPSTTKESEESINTFPLLAIILVNQGFRDTLSMIAALPSYRLQGFRAFLRSLPRSLSVRAYLDETATKTAAGTSLPQGLACSASNE